MQCTLCPTVPHSHGVRYIQQAIHYEGSANSNRQFECVTATTPLWDAATLTPAALLQCIVRNTGRVPKV